MQSLDPSISRCCVQRPLLVHTDILRVFQEPFCSPTRPLQRRTIIVASPWSIMRNELANRRICIELSQKSELCRNRSMSVPLYREYCEGPRWSYFLLLPRELSKYFRENSFSQLVFEGRKISSFAGQFRRTRDRYAKTAQAKVNGHWRRQKPEDSSI